MRATAAGAVALLLFSILTFPLAASAPPNPGAGAGAVSVRAAACISAGAGAWVFEHGVYYATYGSGSFHRAVLAGDGHARQSGGQCIFHGKGAIVTT